MPVVIHKGINMNWSLILLLVIAVIAIAIKASIKKNNTQITEHKYRKIDLLFSPAERSFLGVLNQVIGNKARVFGKVRVADILTPAKGMTRNEWQQSFNKISGKHFDFVLCDSNDLSVLCVLELNDSSHNSKKRTERDHFLAEACISASVPLVQVKAKSSYNIQEVRDSLSQYIRSLTPSTVEEPQKDVTVEPVKVCKKCSSKMVKKIANKGKHKGKEFWACSAFPKCRYIESMDV